MGREHVRVSCSPCWSPKAASLLSVSYIGIPCKNLFKILFSGKNVRSSKSAILDHRWACMTPAQRALQYGLLCIYSFPNSYDKKQSESRSVVSSSLQPHELLYSPWNSPGQNTGMGTLSLLQGLFPTQGLNPGPCIAGGFFTS